MARYLADENVSRRVVAALRLDGHPVDWVAEIMPGAADEVVLDRAVRDGSVLITSDRDFGEMVVRRKMAVVGVVLLALDRLGPEAEAARAKHALAIAGNRLIAAMTVVEPGRIRFRRLPPHRDPLEQLRAVVPTCAKAFFRFRVALERPFLQHRRCFRQIPAHGSFPPVATGGKPCRYSPPTA